MYDKGSRYAEKSEELGMREWQGMDHYPAKNGTKQVLELYPTSVKG